MYTWGDDWTGVRSSHDKRHSVPTHIPIPGPTLSVARRGGGSNTARALLNLDPEILLIGEGVPPSHRQVPENQDAPRPTNSSPLCSLNSRSELPSELEMRPPIIPQELVAENGLSQPKLILAPKLQN